MVQKLVLQNVEKGTVQREVRLVWNNAMRTNHQNFLNFKRNFAPTAVLTKSGIVPISTARQSSSRAAAPVNDARPINTVASKPLVNVAKPRENALQTTHSLSSRPFYQQTAIKNRNLNNNVNAAKANSVNTAKGNKVTSDVGNQGINDVKSSACWVGDLKLKSKIMSPKMALISLLIISGATPIPTKPPATTNDGHTSTTLPSSRHPSHQDHHNNHLRPTAAKPSPQLTPTPPWLPPRTWLSHHQKTSHHHHHLHPSRHHVSTSNAIVITPPSPPRPSRRC
nr:hypothetical protein [Tanacetum cinerariifolium]